MDGEVKKRKRKGERKDKRIQITYTDGVRPDGHPNRISFYGHTRTEALEKRERYKREKEQGLAHGERATTVNDWIAPLFSRRPRKSLRRFDAAYPRGTGSPKGLRDCTSV